MDERRWLVANGNICGDEEGEFTHHGPRGDLVVGYVLANEEAVEELGEFRLEERVE